MRLDWELLVRAFDPGDDGLFGVDPRTGEIVFFGHDELEGDDPEELWDEARYLLVDPVGDGVMGEWLETFAESLEEPLAEALAAAARGSHVVQAAGRALKDRADLRRRWHEYRRRNLCEAAEAWVAARGCARRTCRPGERDAAG